MVVFECVKKEDVEKLIPKGFCKLEPRTIYEDLVVQKYLKLQVYLNQGRFLFSLKLNLFFMIKKELMDLF